MTTTDYTKVYGDFAGLATDKDRIRPRRKGMLRAYCNQAEDGFTCKHCGVFVSCALELASVHNRNHCPYCLWSRHIDLYEPGDRLSACKAPMRPVGLTMKKTRKKYARCAPGELMLIHLCAGCAALSVNRLAADDDPQALVEIFERSLHTEAALYELLCHSAIELLGAQDQSLVIGQLFGSEAAFATG
ncbi:MAG TPA: RNHCP domain-containing protein [Anaerolineaceae bacterium]|nr:RNHCP domain-containing protein [Anaerolineaceae bacterium]